MAFSRATTALNCCVESMILGPFGGVVGDDDPRDRGRGGDDRRTGEQGTDHAHEATRGSTGSAECRRGLESSLTDCIGDGAGLELASVVLESLPIVTSEAREPGCVEEAAHDGRTQGETSSDEALDSHAGAHELLGLLAELLDIALALLEPAAEAVGVGPHVDEEIARGGHDGPPFWVDEIEVRA